MPFELLDHTADVGLRARATSLGEAFEQAALGLTALMVDPGAVRPKERIEIHFEAADLDRLLVQWLSRLLAERDLSGRVFGRTNVKIDPDEPTHLSAELWGEPLDRSRHETRLEVKGVSYLGLNVERTSDGWTIECVLDV